ncbi:MAG TPA: sigma-54 dependent transcriptional regulator, partial [Candidatus Hodarchaeales archaeon]|nr:sigma-54 dependent transcriptional regulator [Candidatus Hodarchaeales archaeon]
MKKVRALVLEYETTDGQGPALQRIFDSSSEFAFQIERSSLKTFQQDSLSSVASSFSPQIIVLFISGNHVPQTVAVFPVVKPKFPDVPFLAVMEIDDSQDIFQLLEMGIDDFVISPIKPGEILLRIRRLLEKNALEDLVSQSIKQKFGLKQMIGESASFLSEIKKIPLYAKSDAIVMITGETGTGKELCARAIHYLSPRSSGPFMPINCGAIPADLVENELFGHEKGAFTGASESRTGLIAEAEGGTVFLDEIDCLPLAAQVKLLRFLQEKEYRPLESKKMKRADVRLLAAMNIDPQEAITAGRLRQDLYYRLNVIPLVIPPLRERREDISLLARHFLLKYAVQFNKPMADFSEEAIQLLQLYDWPGNVRELEHNVERAVVISEGRMIQAKDVVLPSSESDLQESFHDAKMKMIAAFEKTYIERLLLAHHGNISQAARAAQKN